MKYGAIAKRGGAPLGWTAAKYWVSQPDRAAGPMSQTVKTFVSIRP